MATTTRTKPTKVTRRTTPDNGKLPTPAERAALGKTARANVPRTAHAEWLAGPDRDPQRMLCGQDETRVPDLVPIRWGRMLVSPFTFYRGAAALMAGDLATTPASGLRVQACGDAHISNFGVYAAPDRSSSSTSTTSTRRCRARGSGTSSAWRRASRSPAATGAEARAAAQGGRPCRAALPRDDARLRGDDEPPGLVRAPRHHRHGRGARARPGPPRPHEVRGGAAQGQGKSSLRALRSSPRRQRGAALPQRAAAAGQARGPSCRRRAGSTPGSGRSSPRIIRATRASRTTAATSSTATASSTSPARWSASAAWARARG